jgi:hypothetical protein
MFCDVRSMGTPIDGKSLLGLASNGWFTQQSMQFHVMCYLMLYDMVQIYLMYTLPQRWASRTMGLESSFLIRTSQFFFSRRDSCDWQANMLFRFVRACSIVYPGLSSGKTVLFGHILSIQSIQYWCWCSMFSFGFRCILLSSEVFETVPSLHQAALGMAAQANETNPPCIPVQQPQKR